MKKNCVILLLLLMFSSCSSYVKYSYRLCEVNYDNQKDFKIEEIVVPAKVNEDTDIITNNIRVYRYSNKWFDSHWNITNNSITFVIENKTNEPIRIDKDYICFVNINGYVDGVVTDKSFTSDIIIPKGAKYKGIIVPRSCSDSETPLIATFSSDYETTKAFVETNIIGKNISVAIPMEITNKEHLYTFMFKVIGAEVPSM